MFPEQRDFHLSCVKFFVNIELHIYNGCVYQVSVGRELFYFIFLLTRADYRHGKSSEIMLKLTCLLI